MKRGSISVVRFVLPLVFACTALAIAIRLFTVTDSPKSAWVAFHGSTETPYHNVVVVATSGGDYTSIQKALDSITNNSPTNRYLVWVAPGIYNETVTMKPYVDIEGAGELVTRIVGDVMNNPTLFGASNAELRYLTVQNNPRSVWTTAIQNTGASPSLLHVTAIASIATSDAMRDKSDASTVMWTAYGIHNLSGSSPIMADVTVTSTVGDPGIALCYGVVNEVNSSPTMRNVKITVTSLLGAYGVYNSSSSAWMKDVNIFASASYGAFAVYNTGSPWINPVLIDTSTLRISGQGSIISNGQGYVTRVGASKLDGPPMLGTTVTCAGVYDENYVFFPNTCP